MYDKSFNDIEHDDDLIMTEKQIKNAHFSNPFFDIAFDAFILNIARPAIN